MSKSRAADWPSDGPTAAQLKELFAQIESGRITKRKLQSFLRAIQDPYLFVLEDTHFTLLEAKLEASGGSWIEQCVDEAMEIAKHNGHPPKGAIIVFNHNGALMRVDALSDREEVLQDWNRQTSPRE